MPVVWYVGCGPVMVVWYVVCGLLMAAWSVVCGVLTVVWAVGCGLVTVVWAVGWSWLCGVLPVICGPNGVVDHMLLPHQTKPNPLSPLFVHELVCCCAASLLKFFQDAVCVPGYAGPQHDDAGGHVQMGQPEPQCSALAKLANDLGEQAGC